VGGATLKLAFELGSTKWTLGFTTAPARRARVRTIAAGDLVALEKEMLIAKARFGLPLDAAVQKWRHPDRGVRVPSSCAPQRA
jgi:hypothetical protein